MSATTSGHPELKKTMGPVMLWGVGVGLVISGMYFGWNLGLEKGGTGGFAIATIFVILLYVTFSFSYAELACAIPKAGGAFDYATAGLGKKAGFLCGIAQLIEFIFAPPAIAAAIGAYFHIYFPSVPTQVIAIVAYFIFTLMNIIGVRLASVFELAVTILAVVELLIFAGFALPHFELARFTEDPMPAGISGAFAAIPFAIWFFLAIEGVANLAEETINPQKNISIGLGSAIITLVILCILTFLSATGVGGWKAIVYSATGEPSDSPLPLALALISGGSGLMYHLLVGIGLLGLIASFHGIIMAAGRATFEFGRVGFAPAFLGKVNSKFKTPMLALMVNMAIGILALLTGKTWEIITIACFGALTLYIFSILSLFALRQSKPDHSRPFKVPLYPWFPLTALGCSVIAIFAMAFYYPMLALIYLSIIAVCYLFFIFIYKEKKLAFSTVSAIPEPEK
jgi:ethanolamine permease